MNILDGFAWLIMYIHVSWSWRHLGILGNLFQIGFTILIFYIGQLHTIDIMSLLNNADVASRT
jgi:hypothetical protein